MRKLLGLLCLLSVVALAGCDLESTDRNRELSDVSQKTVSEAYLQNDKTVVFRFTDGTMLEMKYRDDKIHINNQDD